MARTEGTVTTARPVLVSVMARRASRNRRASRMGVRLVSNSAASSYWLSASPGRYWPLRIRCRISSEISIEDLDAFRVLRVSLMLGSMGPVCGGRSGGVALWRGW